MPTASEAVPVLVGSGDIAACDSDPGESLTANLIKTMPAATVLANGDLAYDNSTATDFATYYTPPGAG